MCPFTASTIVSRADALSARADCGEWERAPDHEPTGRAPSNGPADYRPLRRLYLHRASPLTWSCLMSLWLLPSGPTGDATPTLTTAATNVLNTPSGRSDGVQHLMRIFLIPDSYLPIKHHQKLGYSYATPLRPLCQTHIPLCQTHI
jgi:hypothetical protein